MYRDSSVIGQLARLLANNCCLINVIICNNNVQRGSKFAPASRCLHSIMQLLYDFYLMQLKVKSKSDGRRSARAAKLKILLHVQVPFSHQHTNTHTQAHTGVQCNQAGTVG